MLWRKYAKHRSIRRAIMLLGIVRPRTKNKSSEFSNCPGCNANLFGQGPAISGQLASEWGLNPIELQLLERQQGFYCQNCGCNLRSMTLMESILEHFNFNGSFADFVISKHTKRLKVLEMNEAGGLNKYLNHIPGHLLASYPSVDLQNLPYDERSFDVIIHSDTLEHVPNPKKALSECRRVLKKDGACFYTIPILIDRRTRNRIGEINSYHGIPLDCANPSEHPNRYLVHQEYGCDAWTEALEAGFSKVSIFSIEYPASLSLICSGFR